MKTLTVLPKTINISTNKGDREFVVRFDRQEGVGLLSTRGGEDYLMLDSIDYWFDLVQYSYPKKKVCACKCQWFFVQFDFVPREGTGDFRSVRIRAFCTKCGKEKNIGSIDLRYSPTQHLLDLPISFCANPRLKCRIKRINGYWRREDRLSFLEFMVDDLGLYATCWYWDSKQKERRLEVLNNVNRERLFSTRLNYLNYYFSSAQPEIETTDGEGGIYVKGDPWRKDEIIQFSSPLTMVLRRGVGNLYYIHLSTQRIEAGVVRDKSASFGRLCDKIIDWLTGNFVESRGKNCFDSIVEYKRLVEPIDL